jgi:hypothetical protein
MYNELVQMMQQLPPLLAVLMLCSAAAIKRES